MIIINTTISIEWFFTQRLLDTRFVGFSYQVCSWDFVQLYNEFRDIYITFFPKDTIIPTIINIMSYTGWSPDPFRLQVSQLFLSCPLCIVSRCKNQFDLYLSILSNAFGIFNSCQKIVIKLTIFIASHTSQDL